MTLARAMIALLLPILGLFACSSAPEPTADPNTRFEGQRLAILLFDKSKAECWQRVETITTERLRSCVGDALPEGTYEFTTDANAFDPTPSRHMAFVGWGLSVEDPTWGEGPEGYLAVIGLGPMPKEGEALLGSRSLTNDGSQLLQQSGNPLSGGSAIVSNGGQTLNKDTAQPIVQSTDKLLKPQQTALICPECVGPLPQRTDIGGRPHFPCPGDHIHTWVFNQNPADCQCRTNKGPVICI